MKIEEHKSLKNYNTFGIDCAAHYFISVKDTEELKEALSSSVHSNIFLLGGGSNMLLTKNIDALVIALELKGIEISSENDDEVILEISAGENWHELVMYCVDRNWGGIENLSLIPGNVGTAPIQNIGAYGVELKDVFVGCKAIDLKTLAEIDFTKEDCQFGYRNSIFKNSERGKYVITSVFLKLTKRDHVLHTGYGAIKNQLAAMQVDQPSIKDISEAVIAIRQSKLPDPKELGNSGSFFKNPVISEEQFKTFNDTHPDAPFYQVDEVSYKIPAGWLIEAAGFKGKRFGDAGVHKNQALVLVNYGSATGEEIWNLAQKIQNEIKEKFNIELEAEVNII